MAEDTLVIKAKDATKAAFASVDRGLGKVRAGLNSTAVRIGILAGVAGFGALIKAGSEHADVLAKQADKIGITTQALAGLQNAGELTGVSSDVLNKALVKQQVAIADYSKGIGLAKDEFEKLGFAQDELINVPADQQFFKIAEALSKVENSTERVNAAYKIYGGRATDLLNTLALGEEGLRKIREESDLFGTSISRVDAAKIEEANDAWSRIGQMTKGLGIQLAAKFAPTLEYIANLFIKIGKDAGGMGVVANNVFDGILTGIGFIADGFRGLQVVWVGLNALFAKGAEKLIESFVAIADGARKIANILPGIDIQPMEGLESVLRAARNRTAELSTELQVLLATPMPSENFEKWSTEVQAHAQAAAEKVAEANSPRNGTSSAALGDQLMSEEELIRFSNARRLLDEQQYNDQQVALALETEQRKREAVAQTFGYLSVLTASTSKKLFNIGKASSVVSAIINTHEAITKTMASVPYPFNIPLAAAQGLAGFVQVQNIRSQQYTGARESGGPVTAGQPYLVGEKRPEIFVPNQSGTILPDANAALGGSVTFAPVVQAYDADDVMRNKDKIFNGLWNQFMDKMNEEGRRFA